MEDSSTDEDVGLRSKSKKKTKRGTTSTPRSDRVTRDKYARVDHGYAYVKRHLTQAQPTTEEEEKKRSKVDLSLSRMTWQAGK